MPSLGVLALCLIALQTTSAYRERPSFTFYENDPGAPELLKEVHPKLPRRGESTRSHVVLELFVDAQGLVDHVKVHSYPPWPEADEAFIAAAKRWRFEPKLIEGRAVPVRMVVYRGLRPGMWKLYRFMMLLGLLGGSVIAYLHFRRLRQEQNLREARTIVTRDDFTSIRTKENKRPVSETRPRWLRKRFLKPRKTRVSPELHPGWNYSRGHIPHITGLMGATESLFGLRIPMPSKAMSDHMRVFLSVVLAVVVNIIMLSIIKGGLNVFFEPGGFHSYIQEPVILWNGLVMILTVSVSIGVFSMVFYFLSGQYRTLHEVPVFLIGFALLSLTYIVYYALKAVYLILEAL